MPETFAITVCSGVIWNNALDKAMLKTVIMIREAIISMNHDDRFNNLFNIK